MYFSRFCQRLEKAIESLDSDIRSSLNSLNDLLACIYYLFSAFACLLKYCKFSLVTYDLLVFNDVDALLDATLECLEAIDFWCLL
jgi:hypothetical protein